MTSSEETLNVFPRINPWHALVFCGNLVIVGTLVWVLTARSPATGNGSDAASSTTPALDITYTNSRSYLKQTGSGNGATSGTGSTFVALPFLPDDDDSVTDGEGSLAKPMPSAHTENATASPIISSTTKPTPTTSTIITTPTTTSTTTLTTTQTTNPTTTPTTTTEEILFLSGSKPPPYEVVCYFNHTSFRRQTPMSFRTGHVPVSFCTHAVYASVGISDDLELIAKEPEFDIVQGGLAKFAALKRTHPHLTVLAAIGEDMKDSSAFNMVSKSSEDRKTFAKNVQFWLNRFSYDGIVVHWKQYHEPQAAHYRDELNRIVATLRHTLGSTQRIYIGVPNDQEVALFDLATLFQSVDQIFVLPHWMLNEDGSTKINKSKITAFPDPLYDVLRTKHSLVSAGRGTLFQKFCFVFSIAGRSYTLADGDHYEINSNALGPGKPGPFTGTPGILAFYEICNSTWTTKVKGTYGSYAVKDDQWIGYLDAPSLERVLRMVLWKHKAACVGIWDVSLDDFRGICGDRFPLTKVIAGWHDRIVV